MTTTPYLSVVATSRNDNHGGNMLRRMQIFINGLLEQCRRHQVNAELIIVEWNPPSDNPSLADVLSWQIADSPCVVRIIQVPPEVHAQLNHAASLPLFQMIAKNVGIRRARGQFVLATNIDLLFSDELFSFIASRQLHTGAVYRLDRHDAAADVPLNAPLSEQLDYCAQNILRICHKDGFTEPNREESPAESDTPLVETPQPKWYKQVLEPAKPVLVPLRKFYQRLFPKSVRDSILRMVPRDVANWLISQNLLTAQQLPSLPESDPETPSHEQEEHLSALWRYPQLHTNACGDFTLMSKEDWFAVRGYPEWEIFSFHLDSVLLYIAHYAGIKEVILDDLMRMYHIEHTSGWTPETERTQILNKRLASLKVPQLSGEQFDAVVQLMHQLNKPLIFNDENWGMVAASLPDMIVTSDRDINPAIAHSINPT
ncbi:MAG: hypothetical protein DCF22_12080 [Leptolyngbya sp.]|nr:MAG: hypothetical protein DCF22_12080 [Leptolyngbya sp.]